jgi:anthranilate synthase component 1
MTRARRLSTSHCPIPSASEAPTARSFSAPCADLLALHRALPARYPFLLESAAPGPRNGRFDILFGFPGDSLVLHADGRIEGPEPWAGSADFLDALDAWWRSLRTAERAESLPFSGGWFVYLGYELAGQIEPGLHFHAPQGLPVAFATRIVAAIVRDRAAPGCLLVVEDGQEALVEPMREDLAAAGAAPRNTMEPAAIRMDEDPPGRFLEAVRRAREHIEAGDIYQANLSRQWSGQAAGVDAAAIYGRLRQTNAGPFAGLARWRDSAIISSSPERLLRIRGSIAESRPIAGTRPRHAAAIADRRLSEELIAHPKERAEHVMLIDLVRNDLGRVCIPGSVEVDEMMAVESHPHVHHIVSNVRGLLPAAATPGQVMRAMFPGGTITGCPKVRCMQIIDELENAPRGAYTGSMGYLNRDGSCDLNILIRTIVQHGTHLSLRAGAGIVADSDPARELDECRAKARGLLLALGA